MRWHISVLLVYYGVQQGAMTYLYMHETGSVVLCCMALERAVGLIAAESVPARFATWTGFVLCLRVFSPYFC
jgi:hypothetical protein